MPTKRRRRKRSQPYLQEAQWDIAYRDLLSRNSIKQGSGAGRTSTDRKVKEFGPVTWLVSGGQCVHKVTLGTRGALVCLDHSPAHPPTKPGYACCHVLAVYKMLAWKHIPLLFTPDGFRRRNTERQAS